jgi:hypothetical protein
MQHCGIVWWDESIEMEGVVDCMYLEHRFKHLNCQYIYRISYRNAKKANPGEMDLPLLKKRYHRF